MERTTVYLTAAQKRALSKAAKTAGRSEADLIREGVAIVISRYVVAEPTIPLFDSGRSDLATQADDDLDGFGEW